MVHGSLIEWTQLITHQSTDRSGYKKWKGLVKMSRKISQRKQVSFADRIANCRNSTSHLSISQYQQTMKTRSKRWCFFHIFKDKTIGLWSQEDSHLTSVGLELPTLLVPGHVKRSSLGSKHGESQAVQKLRSQVQQLNELNVVVLYTWNTWMFYEHHHLKNAAIFVYASVTYLSVSFTVWAWLSIPNCFRYI